MPSRDEVSLFTAPLAATRGWSDAVTACGGVCACSGQCGRMHASTQGRCAHALTAGYTLFLTETGVLLCARCFNGYERALCKAERAAQQAAPQPVSLLDLLTADGGLT